MIKLIAAADDCFGIGKNGQIPWHLPEDLKRFAKLTRNNTVIMGRGTADSLPNWLPDRYNVVVTNSMPATQTMTVESKRLTVHYLPSVEEALDFAGSDCWVIGGESVYEQTIHRADWLYLTHVHGDYHCDRFFPEIPDEYVEVARESHLTGVPTPYEFLTFRRVPAG